LDGDAMSLQFVAGKRQYFRDRVVDIHLPSFRRGVLALSVFYGITSEGLTESPLRLQFGRAHRHAFAKADHEGLRTE
jgi:hypothetical protein